MKAKLRKHLRAQRRALELILTGRPFSAAEACEWGFVNAVYEPAALLREALATAAAIADNAPLATRQAKINFRV